MDTFEAITTRRSIRAFTDRMPSQEDISTCLEAATWAPSATNQQPWEFIVLTGEALAKVNAINQRHFAERLQGGDPFSGLLEHLRKRQEDIMSALMAACAEAGIDANEFFEKMLCFCGAPVGVYFVTYAQPDDKYVLSVAAATENFLLAARALGLGACWLNAVVVCQEDIKELLGIAPEKVILGGIALGYPVEDSPINTFTRTRIPAAELTTWLGFDA